MGTAIIPEAHAAPADGPTRRDSEAILLGAPDRATWLELARALLDWLDRGPDVALVDLAYTLNVGQPAFPFRVGLVAASLEELRGRLRHVAARLADPECRSIRDGRGAYFVAEPARAAARPGGQGGRGPALLAGLCRRFPEVRQLFEDAPGRPDGRPGERPDAVPGDFPRGRPDGGWPMPEGPSRAGAGPSRGADELPGEGMTRLNHLVAALFAEGESIRPDLLYARRRPVRIDLAAEPSRSGRGWTASVLDHLEAIAGIADEDPAMASYLRTMEAFLETQRAVMDAYLAARPRPE